MPFLMVYPSLLLILIRYCICTAISPSEPFTRTNSHESAFQGLTASLWHFPSGVTSGSFICLDSHENLEGCQAPIVAIQRSADKGKADSPWAMFQSKECGTFPRGHRRPRPHANWNLRSGPAADRESNPAKSRPQTSHCPAIQQRQRWGAFLTLLACFWLYMGWRRSVAAY